MDENEKLTPEQWEYERNTALSEYNNGAARMDEAQLNALYQQNKLEIFQLYQRYEGEWKERWRKHQEENGPQPTVEDMVKLQMGACDELVDLVQGQKRMIEFTAYGKTEPKTHFANAVIIGKFGAG